MAVSNQCYLGFCTLCKVAETLLGGFVRLLHVSSKGWFTLRARICQVLVLSLCTVS